VEKICGDSMLAFIKNYPLRLLQEAFLLAQLHLETSKTKVNLPLHSAKERAKFLVHKSTLLSTEMKGFIDSFIDELPEGEAICHGDFHPGNILKSNGENYIIDWFGAYQGDILSDVAHSYLVMKNVPVIPGLSKAQHMFMKIAGNLLANQYLGAFYRIHRFNWSEFSKWLVVKAAERSFYGLPSEKTALQRFIASCYQLREKGIGAASWYRRL
jgi:hypothetical protein